jgi:hypothetical protein
MTAQAKGLAETDYAYLAGIIDGEGAITICRQTIRRKGRTSFAYGPELYISNTDLVMIKSLQRRFGGHIVKTKPRPDKLWKQGYLLFFRRDEMLTLLPRVIPYLTTKRRKAMLLLEYMTSRTKHVKKSGADGRFVGVPLTERQKKIIAEIRKKNRRGPPI